MSRITIECVNPDKGKTFFVIWDTNSQNTVIDEVGNELQFLTKQEAERFIERTK